MMSVGLICILPYCMYFVLTLQSSDFLLGVWANSKGSLPKIKPEPIRCWINSSCGRARGCGWEAFLLYDTKNFKNTVQNVQWHDALDMKDWLKLNYSTIVVQRARAKLFIKF